MPLSDAELAARVLGEDDRRAFAELVRRHQSAVRGLLRRLTAGDAALADDLAQQVFVTAWRKLATWRGGARLSTWLYRIAWNAWASQARRAPPPEPPPPEPARGTEEAVLGHRDLERALVHLRQEERAALAVTYGQELTHEEAAELLGCPVGTLKTNVSRGKEKLRRLLVPALEGKSMTRDPIDDLLDEPTPIPDDGFTQRVMAALPPPRSRVGALDRWLPLLGGGVVVAALTPDLAALSRGLAASALLASQGAAQGLASAAGGGGLQAALTLMAALAVAAAVIGSWLVVEPS